MTGNYGAIARLHPLIKGIYGAQSSGGALVSFNAPAFESYGKEQGDNSPVSEYAANAYGKALNYLVSNRNNNRVISNTTIVFWSQTGDEEYSNYLSSILDDTKDSDELRLIGIMDAIAKGKKCRYMDTELSPDTRFYILGISPNAARLSVRFFYTDSFGTFITNIKAHYDRLMIQKPSYEKSEYPTIKNILYETVNQNSRDKQASPILVGSLFSSIITNQRYPAMLLSAVIMRIRADHRINRNRAAIIKAYLIKNHVKVKEVVQNVNLDENTNYAPYVLGRIFSLLEAIQEAANPTINSTIKDRFFNSACATPAIIFPQLFKLMNNHLRVLEREKKGLKIDFEKKLGQLMDCINHELPQNQSLEEQGIFIIGYYHQTQKRYLKKEDKNI